MSGDLPDLSFPRSRVAVIRLQRPGQANRIGPGDLVALHTHIDAIDARGDVSVLILASSGQTFSGGFDLGALSAAPVASDAAGRDDSFGVFADRLARVTPVTIAALQGPVVGGATDLALACDLRIGTSRASFMMPAARIGMPLYASALHRFVAAFGVSRAKQLVLTSRSVPAVELMACGVLAEIVEDIDARALDMALELADLPAAPLCAMKSVLTSAARGDGPTSDERACLDAAYDAALIAGRVAAMALARRRS